MSFRRPICLFQCVKRAARYIEDENNRILNRHGIFMLDPMEKGLRCVRHCTSLDRSIDVRFFLLDRSLYHE